MSNEPPKTASEEVQKPKELSAEELEKAAGGATIPTDLCNKIEKALSEKELEQVTGGGEKTPPTKNELPTESMSLNFTKLTH